MRGLTHRYGVGYGGGLRIDMKLGAICMKKGLLDVVCSEHPRWVVGLEIMEQATGPKSTIGREGSWMHEGPLHAALLVWRPRQPPVMGGPGGYINASTCIAARNYLTRNF
jgi:hypothetical protein